MRATARLALAAWLVAVAAPGALAVDEPADEAAPVVTLEAALVGADGEPIGGPRRLLLGEAATLVLTLRGPADARYFVPSNPALGSFRLRGKAAPAERAEEGARATEVYRLPVVPLRLGAEAIPPIEVAWQRPDGTSGAVTTPRLRARVDGRLLNEADPALAPPPDPVPVKTTHWALVWALSVLGALVVASLATVIALRLLRGRLAAAAPLPPPRPANVVALEALAWLEGSELEAPERYARTVDVLRAYLGGLFGFDGLEQTTREMMAALRGEALGDATGAEVRTLLEDADLVKFARLRPSEEEASALIGQVRALVERTWRPPEEPEAEEAEPVRPRLEPASGAERARAGALDVALATSLGAIGLGALGAVGRLDLGWSAVLLAGVALAARDLAGPGSPGKALLGLRVVSRTPEQEAPTPAQRLMRNALLLLPPVGLPVEALVLAYHPLRYRVGDLWARTEVVRRGRT